MLTTSKRFVVTDEAEVSVAKTRFYRLEPRNKIKKNNIKDVSLLAVKCFTA